MMSKPAITPEMLRVIRDTEPTQHLSPVKRLLLAILRQAVLDYYTGNERQQRDALRYFRESPLYQLTLLFFNLAEDTLPQGVDLERIPERRHGRQHDTHPELPVMLAERLERSGQAVPLLPLMSRLKGNRLHVFLTIYLLEQPVTVADVAFISAISEDTVRRQVAELESMGLLVRMDAAEAGRTWVISAEAATIINTPDE